MNPERYQQFIAKAQKASADNAREQNDEDATENRPGDQTSASPAVVPNTDGDEEERKPAASGLEDATGNARETLMPRSPNLLETIRVPVTIRVNVAAPTPAVTGNLTILTATPVRIMDPNGVAIYPVQPARSRDCGLTTKSAVMLYAAALILATAGILAVRLKSVSVYPSVQMLGIRRSHPLRLYAVSSHTDRTADTKGGGNTTPNRGSDQDTDTIPYRGAKDQDRGSDQDTDTVSNTHTYF